MKTIKQVLKGLKSVEDKSIRVTFSLGYSRPTTIDSWRGIYDEPALGYETEGKISVEELICEIEDSINGKIFHGYKGGEYTYTEEDELHVDNYGESSETEISHLDISEHEVIIHVTKP